MLEGEYGVLLIVCGQQTHRSELLSRSAIGLAAVRALEGEDRYYSHTDLE